MSLLNVNFPCIRDARSPNTRSSGPSSSSLGMVLGVTTPDGFVVNRRQIYHRQKSFVIFDIADDLFFFVPNITLIPTSSSAFGQNGRHRNFFFHRLFSQLIPLPSFSPTIKQISLARVLMVVNVLFFLFSPKDTLQRKFYANKSTYYSYHRTMVRIIHLLLPNYCVEYKFSKLIGQVDLRTHYELHN